jgi:lipocalin
MRIVQSVVFAVACAVVAACTDTSVPSANPALPPPQTVQPLDHKMLSGLWYEIGRIPAENEKTHTAGVVSFTPTANGALAFSYRWHEGVIDGPAREATAVAVPEDPAHPGRLKLRSATNGLPSALWVLELSADDMTCVVGSPDRKIAMMLHRRPAIFVDTFGELARVLEGQGYPVDKLLLATQAPSAQ